MLGSDGLADTLGRLLAGDGTRFRDREELLAVARGRGRARGGRSTEVVRATERPALPRTAAPPQEEQNAPFASTTGRPRRNGSRPGIVYVNTSAPQTPARFDVVVDACHEAVPGHHLQESRSPVGSPACPRSGAWAAPAYQEGWACMRSRRARDGPLPPTDLLTGSSPGQGRAAILPPSSWTPVCTRWAGAGRKRSTTSPRPAFPAELAAREVDRYLAWPGQALSYKVGQLEILALREEARQRQGPGFDIRRFHDVVLGSGALPLVTLRELVQTELR